MSGSQKRKIRKEKEYNIKSKYAKLDNFLISASSSSCVSASSSNARELDEQILEVEINPQEKSTVSDTSTNKDILKKDQLSIIIRYVITDVNDNNEPDNIRINETFLGFIEAANQTAKSLESDVLNFLNILDINLAKCRGQGYDGAANMSGAYGGLQKLIKDKQPRANYVHCSTHNLNLVLNDASNNMPHNLRNNFANIKEEAIGLAKKWGITPEFEKKRHRKVRQFFDDFNADEKLQDRKRLFEVDVFKANVDVITTQLKNRFQITSAMAERSFSKLKLIKNYLRCTHDVRREALSYLSLISTEQQEARKIELNELITDFAKKNVRRQWLFL
ncbi:hypothetical protein TNCV_2409811 [Trichonephila clavipes]|nr:hypothetical protein TNCV_2409811 [Trichonephila clavipes]